MCAFGRTEQRGTPVLRVISSAVVVSDRLYASARQAGRISARIGNREIRSIVADLCVNASELRAYLARLQVAVPRLCSRDDSET
jgi:hypothetical protein